MDYRRFNIAELSRETKTGRTTLHEWIRNGWLEHVQIVGSRKKYSIDGFLKAEKIALTEATRQEAIEMAGHIKNTSKNDYSSFTGNRKVRTIPDEWFDNLDTIIALEDQKKTLAAKSTKNHGKRITNNFSQK
ncbi:MAG: hypothetical protein KIT33_15925 [Candidatus Kapabacteria bacterium]|nr:hypothetical protein [Ignavibacteriota bacterium]MCW5886460.1 hypothetical protein [Candidatus Kapabacteria bacterium]